MSAVSLVATGAFVTGSAATLSVSSPAGAIGDLLVFVMGHDDYSDGAFVPNAPPLTMNELISGAPQLADDSRYAVFWAIEDQAAGRSFTFDWAAVEGFAARCWRYVGHNATTPIQGGSVRRALATQTPDSIDLYGSAAIYILGGDVAAISDDIASAPTGYTTRGQDSGNGMALYCADKIAGDADYPYPHEPGDVGAHYPDVGAGPFGSQGTIGMSFIIASAAVARTIAGVTKDNDGAVKASVDVSLFKRDGASPPDYVFVESQVSNGSGVYSFTVEEDNDAQFVVVGNSDDSPDSMDVTSNDLQPT